MYILLPRKSAFYLSLKNFITERERYITFSIQHIFHTPYLVHLNRSDMSKPHDSYTKYGEFQMP